VLKRVLDWRTPKKRAPRRLVEGAVIRRRRPPRPWTGHPFEAARSWPRWRAWARRPLQRRHDRYVASPPSVALAASQSSARRNCGGRCARSSRLSEVYRGMTPTGPSATWST